MGSAVIMAKSTHECVYFDTPGMGSQLTMFAGLRAIRVGKWLVLKFGGLETLVHVLVICCRHECCTKGKRAMTMLSCSVVCTFIPYLFGCGKQCCSKGSKPVFGGVQCIAHAYWP